MPRIRTIKPSFYNDDKLIECSVSARYMFIGTWVCADDAGNLERNEKQLKLWIFPFDDINVGACLDELITHGLLIEYSVSAKNYLHIPGFAKHQVINRPSKPVCPVYEGSMRT